LKKTPKGVGYDQGAQHENYSGRECAQPRAWCGTSRCLAEGAACFVSLDGESPAAGVREQVVALRYHVKGPGALRRLGTSQRASGGEVYDTDERHLALVSTLTVASELLGLTEKESPDPVRAGQLRRAPDITVVTCGLVGIDQQLRDMPLIEPSKHLARTQEIWRSKRRVARAAAPDSRAQRRRTSRLHCRRRLRFDRGTHHSWSKIRS
jgi:hypothetical protein